jgi:hypothetical protein
MYHYTYLIQHKTENKRYIGVRSSKVPPTEDVTYWGSSKHLPKDVQQTHAKIILKVHTTRELALLHEIHLHEVNDVVVDTSYYNKAKQTSVGFDTTGTKLSDEHKLQCSIALKGRVFTDEHKSNISKATLGKPKSAEHKKNCSIAQKKCASTAGYKNPRQGATLSDETKSKMSSTIKARKVNAGINNNRFAHWFITNDGITTLYYDKTKEDVAIEHGYAKGYYRDLATKSKGHVPIKRGALKGAVIGNIADAKANIGKPNSRVQKRAWFITYDTYSIPFYYTTRKEYAEQHNISPQSVADAIHLSKGVKQMKKGPFKGLILGKIS